MGRAVDKDSNMEGFQQINQATQDALNNNYKERELNVKETLAENKMENENSKLDLTAQKLRLEAEKLEVAREKIKNEKFTSIINKN